MDKKGRTIPQGRFQKKIQKKNQTEMCWVMESHMEMFQEGGRCQKNICSQMILNWPLGEQCWCDDGSRSQTGVVWKISRWWKKNGERGYTQIWKILLWRDSVGCERWRGRNVAAEHMNDSVKVSFPSIVKIGTWLKSQGWNTSKGRA